MRPVGSPFGSSTRSSPTTRAATIGRVLDALGVDPPEGQKSMKRQSDDLSKDWVARFRADSERLESA